MATRIDVPRPLLAAVDRKPRTRQISRSRLIIQALALEVAAHEVAGRNWSPGFFDQLRGLDPEAARELRKTMAVVRTARGSRPAVKP